MSEPVIARRRLNPLLRVMISGTLVAFAIFVVVYRKSVPPARSGPPPAADSRPFPSDAPSSEGAQRFSWVPSFPGAELHDINTKLTRGELSYGFSFHTDQDFPQVLAFYRDRLRALGFEANLKDSEAGGGELHAEDRAAHRSLDVVAAKVVSGPGAEIAVTAVQR